MGRLEIEDSVLISNLPISLDATSYFWTVAETQ